MQSQKKSMAGVVSCVHVSKKFGELDVLNDVTFVAHQHEKIGLVGPNGSGKSTLLKIISGAVVCDSGTVTFAKNTIVEYLPQIHTDPATMSGGEMAKKVLAPIIASSADVFLLDEPTNNLDDEGLAMVENFITHSNKTFLIVSHDRRFLDRTVNKILEIDATKKTCSIYDGNYSAYVHERRVRIEREWEAYADKTERIEKMNASVDQRLSWVKKIEDKRKNTRNLPMHEKNKPQAAVLRDMEAKAGRRARVMKDRLEKYKVDTSSISKPIQLRPLRIAFICERGSTNVFKLEGVTKKMGARTLGPLDLLIQYGERLHIVGPNGAGKTTLLKLLLGKLTSDTGILQRGENVRIGYIAQQRWSDSTRSVLQEFMTITNLEQTEARKILNRFRLVSDDIKKRISELSPGQYSRCVLAQLVAQKPNCIILDEPSNHLDSEALEELEEGLREFTGTLIVVSHDRYFIEKVGFGKEYNIIY